MGQDNVKERLTGWKWVACFGNLISPMNIQQKCLASVRWLEKPERRAYYSSVMLRKEAGLFSVPTVFLCTEQKVSCQYGPSSMSNLPFLLRVSVHKQWRTSAKQRELQEEVRQPRLCDSLWSEPCLGWRLAAERGQGFVPCVHGWAAVLYHPQNHCGCGFGQKKGWAPLNMQHFCLLLSTEKVVRISPAPASPVLCCPLPSCLSKTWPRHMVLKSSPGVGGSCREQGSGGDPEPSQVWTELKKSWEELGAVVSSARADTGSSCTELSPASKAKCHSVAMLSGVCVSLFSAVSGSGAGRVLWWVPATLSLSGESHVVLGMGRATILALCQGHVGLSRGGGCFLCMCKPPYLFINIAAVTVPLLFRCLLLSVTCYLNP